MTLIALVDNFDALEERLTELERDGNAAIGLCSLSGVLWELFINTHKTKLIKLMKKSQLNGSGTNCSKNWSYHFLHVHFPPKLWDL